MLRPVFLCSSGVSWGFLIRLTRWKRANVIFVDNWRGRIEIGRIVVHRTSGGRVSASIDRMDNRIACISGIVMVAVPLQNCSQSSGFSLFLDFSLNYVFLDGDVEVFEFLVLLETKRNSLIIIKFSQNSFPNLSMPCSLFFGRSDTFIRDGL